MPKKTTLTPEEREFFSLVTRSIYMNPFLDERKQTLFRIAPDWAPGRSIAPELAAHIDRLDRKGIRKIQHFEESDGELLFHAYLYQEYLRCFTDLEKLIQNQLGNRGVNLTVAFADRVIERLKKRGFSTEDSNRFFSLFYQLSRAFHLISNALIGDCPSMKALRLDLWNNVFTHDVGLYHRHLWNRMEDFSTLLLGETGTGKGSAAAAIGRSGYIPYDLRNQCFSGNFMETFIAITLSQFPETLIESELFGHKKGAFTGAVGNHEGLFELCSAHGALFLDEIGDIGIPIQIKLLQVLQERTFSPVGSHNLKRFEGRVIAATNRSIEELRRQGKFRDDFFYRLCSDVITVPTLRQRIEESLSELELMANLLVTRITGEENQNLTDMVLETLKQDLSPDYQWPGNVRELEQAVRSILLKRHYYGDRSILNIQAEEDFVQKIYTGGLEAKELLRQYCRIVYNRFGTYEAVAKRINLDPRTVKKYLQ